MESSARQTVTRLGTASRRSWPYGVIDFPHPESMLASRQPLGRVELTDTDRASTSSESSSSLVLRATNAAFVDFVLGLVCSFFDAPYSLRALDKMSLALLHTSKSCPCRRQKVQNFLPFDDSSGFDSLALALDTATSDESFLMRAFQ